MASKVAQTMSSPKATGERASRSTGMELLARAGIAARGGVYLIIGILALKLALGSGGKTTDQQGALKTLAGEPFGKVALGLLAVGLLGYALWRAVRAVLGHGVTTGGDDTKDRVDSAFSAFSYGVLGISAAKILIGAGGGGSSSPDSTTAGVMGWPLGRWLVLVAGLVVIGIGVQQMVKGWQRKFCEDADTSKLDQRARTAYEWLGVAGHLARGLIFVLMGGFVIKAAIEFDPKKAVGLDGALAATAQSPGGKVALAVVALGLICFAAYSFVDARVKEV